MKTLICACCGASAPGSQWWNRDTGYGVCSRCFDTELARNGLDEAVRLYGHPGRHHSPTRNEILEIPHFPATLTP